MDETNDSLTKRTHVRNLSSEGLLEKMILQLILPICDLSTVISLTQVSTSFRRITTSNNEIWYNLLWQAIQTPQSIIPHETQYSFDLPIVYEARSHNYIPSDFYKNLFYKVFPHIPKSLHSLSQINDPSFHRQIAAAKCLVKSCINFPEGRQFAEVVVCYTDQEFQESVLSARSDFQVALHCFVFNPKTKSRYGEFYVYSKSFSWGLKTNFQLKMHVQLVDIETKSIQEEIITSDEQCASKTPFRNKTGISYTLNTEKIERIATFLGINPFRIDSDAFPDASMWVSLCAKEIINNNRAFWSSFNQLVPTWIRCQTSNWDMQAAVDKLTANADGNWKQILNTFEFPSGRHMHSALQFYIAAITWQKRSELFKSLFKDQKFSKEKRAVLFRLVKSLNVFGVETCRGVITTAIASGYYYNSTICFYLTSSNKKEAKQFVISFTCYSTLSGMAYEGALWKNPEEPLTYPIRGLLTRGSTRVLEIQNNRQWLINVGSCVGWEHEVDRDMLVWIVIKMVDERLEPEDGQLKIKPGFLSSGITDLTNKFKGFTEMEGWSVVKNE